MARRKKGTRRRKAKPSLMEGVAYVGIPAALTYQGYQTGGAMGGANRLIASYSGYSINDGTFDATRLMRGLVPTLGLTIGTRIVRKVGLARTPKWLPFKIF